MRLTLRRSLPLACGIAGAHLVAAACVLLAWPSVAGAGLAVPLGLLGAITTWRLALLGGTSAPRVLDLSQDGSMEVVLQDGTRVEVSATAPRHVTRLWVVLRTDFPACRTLLVSADMLDPDDFRRLRIWSWWGGAARGGSPAVPG